MVKVKSYDNLRLPSTVINDPSASITDLGLLSERWASVSNFCESH